MIGTEKQIAWATTIREQVAINAARAMKLESEDIRDIAGGAPEECINSWIGLIQAQYDMMMSNESSAWWIENSGLAIGYDAPDSKPIAYDQAVRIANIFTKGARKEIKALRAQYGV